MWRVKAVKVIILLSNLPPVSEPGKNVTKTTCDVSLHVWCFSSSWQYSAGRTIYKVLESRWFVFVEPSWSLFAWSIDLRQDNTSFFKVLDDIQTKYSYALLQLSSSWSMDMVGYTVLLLTICGYAYGNNVILIYVAVSIRIDIRSSIRSMQCVQWPGRLVSWNLSWD